MTTLSAITGDVASELARQFPQQVFDESHTAYKSLQKSYWAGNQRELKPKCFFQPQSAADVARAVTLLAKAGCPFGVKSGGHGHFAGQSCLDGGIQLDLVKMNTIAINREKDSVLVGAGCTWRSIYQKLEGEGLMAIGGRSAGVGVGGFLVGGGISFYAANHGWGVNNVRSFEVVLANGTIVTASKDSEPKLFQALRGGGSNFGIITAFELITYPYRGIWGGRTLLETGQEKVAIEAYADFIPKMDLDPKGHTIIIFNFDEGPPVLLQYLVYTEPVEDHPMFDKLRQVPAAQSSLGLTNYSNIAEDIADLQGGDGDRMAVATITVRLDKELLEEAFEIFAEEAAPVSHYIKGCLEFHAIPRASHPEDNVYGIEFEGHLIALMIGFSFREERYDNDVYAIQKRIMAKVKKVAERRGLYHPFLFANYAAKFQDVVGSYGDGNNEFLSRVAKVYDPEQVFQRLHQGSFKLSIARRGGRL